MMIKRMDTTIRRLLGKEFMVGRRKAFVAGADREIGISCKYKSDQMEVIFLNKEVIFNSGIKYPNRVYHLTFTYIMNLIDKGKARGDLFIKINKDGEIKTEENKNSRFQELMTCPFE